MGLSRDCPFFSGTPYYVRNGKNYGFQIWPVHSEDPSQQKPIKNFTEKGAWAYPGTAQFLEYPLLSQELKKLRISNLASSFRGSIRTKLIKNFREKRAWAYPGTAHFLRVPPVISGTGKATNFKFCMHIYRLNRNKCPLKFLGKVAMDVVRDS